MMKQNKSLLFALTTVLLTGCNHYSIDKGYDSFRNKNKCVLKDNLLSFDYQFYRSRRTQLDLEKLDDHTIRAYLNVDSYDFPTHFKPDSIVISKVFNRNGSTEEFQWNTSEGIHNKAHKELIYGGYAYHAINRGDTGGIFTLTKDQLQKISRAEKIRMSIETTREPIIFELNHDDLEPLRKYFATCF